MDFETMVRRGLGRAVLYARENDVSAHRDFLIHACLNNIAYDAQLSGDQSAYMFDIINATDEAHNYTRGIRDALNKAGDDYNPQVYDILRRICEQGDESIRPYLYKSIAHELSQGDTSSADVLVKLDGLTGFLFVLEQLDGQEIDEDDWWKIEDIFEALEDKIGKEQTESALGKAIADHPIYARYREIISRRREPRQRVTPSFAVPSYEQIAHTIATANVSPGYGVTRWGRDADEETVLKIASDFLADADELHQVYYLRFFWKRPFPLSPDKLLRLAESEDSKTAWLARTVLSNITYPGVRELALKILHQPGDPMTAVAMLTHNFQEGDWKIVTETIYRELPIYEYHRVEMDVRELFEMHPKPEAKNALLALYERGPCLLCRHAMIEDLQTLGSLPDWMIEECRYDAYEVTRELAESLLAG